MPLRFLFCLALLIAAHSTQAVVVPTEGSALHHIHVLFEWTPAAGTEYQLVAVVDDGSPDPFTAPTVVDVTVPSTAPRTPVTSGLVFDTSYAWRVRGVDMGTPLAWGPTHRFATAALPAYLPAISVTPGTGTPEPGLTLFNIRSQNMSVPRGGVGVAVDSDGDVVWFYESPGQRLSDIRLLPSGRLLIVLGGRARITTLSGRVSWISPNHPDVSVHHEAFPMPNGNVLAAVTETQPVVVGQETQLWRGDRFVEFDRADSDVIWSWNTFDHFSTLDFDPTVMANPSNPGQVGEDFEYAWTHSNAVIYDPVEDSVYASVRHLSRITRIDRATETIVYNMGFDMPSGDVDFGDNLFSFQHAPELLANGNLMVYDNGNRRDHMDQTPATGVTKAIELAFTGVPPTSAQIVWEYTLPVYTPFVGDADRLPGGNTLVTAGGAAKLYEVDASSTPGEVWRLELPAGTPDYFIYRSERIPALIATASGDLDGDGLADDADNCPDHSNAPQLDVDGDDLGDACDHDNDDDGIIDLYETNTGIFVSERDTGSDPLLVDTDSDGFDDLTEVLGGSDPSDDQSIPDSDADGIADLDDNCSAVANASQIDVDEDGYGNACDPDYDDNGIVGGPDFLRLRNAFGTSLGDPGYDPLLDSDEDDTIGGMEFLTFRFYFGTAPGPSGLACAGIIVPCTAN